MGKREIEVSLATTDRSEAVKRARIKAVEYDQKFDKARVRRDATQVQTVPEPELAKIARGIFREELTKHTQNFERLDNRTGYDLHLSEELDDVRYGLEENIWALWITEKVRDAMEANGLRLREDTSDFRKARIWIARALASAIMTATKRSEGDFGFIFNDPLAVEGQRRLPASSSFTTNLPQASLTLRELVERYMKDPKRARLTKKTKDGYRVIFRLLRELLGEDTLVRDVTRDDCRRVREVLLDLPPNATKRFPGLTAYQAVQKGKELGLKPLSPAAVNSYLSNLSALFNYSVVEDYAEKNPARNLTVPVGVKKKDRRLPFSVKQLHTIFTAPLYTGCLNDQRGYATSGPNVIRRGRFWVPLVALYAGLRLNEACQLLVADILKTGGVDCIRVEETVEDQRVKSKTGERIVPIHPDLVSFGLLEYAKKMKKAGEKFLFPELTVGHNGYRSDPFSQWFGRFLEKCGAKAPRTAFHSFRHNWTDALRDAGVRRILGGWKADNISSEGDYGKGFSPKVRYEEIKRLAYPELDLSHLIPR